VLLGEYEHSVDAKGRVAVPAKFRPQLETGLVVTRGFERCLFVYPIQEWASLAQRVSAVSFLQAEARQLRRLLFASAFHTELDKQGRILLPAPLREYASIGDTATVAGMNTYFEIWAKEAWDSEQSSLADEAGAIAAAMAALGI
jgi:MraZ protein